MGEKNIRQILEHLNLFDIYFEFRHFPINFKREKTKSLWSVQLVRKCDYIHDQIETVYCFFFPAIFRYLRCWFVHISFFLVRKAWVVLYICIFRLKVRSWDWIQAEEAMWRHYMNVIYFLFSSLNTLTCWMHRITRYQWM